MECLKEENLERCNCSNVVCGKRGVCCECVASHLKKRQLPACAFPDDVEKTWNRSFEKFAELVQEGSV